MFRLRVCVCVVVLCGGGEAAADPAHAHIPDNPAQRGVSRGHGRAAAAAMAAIRQQQQAPTQFLDVHAKLYHLLVLGLYVCIIYI